jgi:hypothetical protein
MRSSIQNSHLAVRRCPMSTWPSKLQTKPSLRRRPRLESEGPERVTAAKSDTFAGCTVSFSTRSERVLDLVLLSRDG